MTAPPSPATRESDTYSKRALKLRHFALHYCTAVLLVVMAVRQVYYVHVHRLSPWKGGGFGMFSTVDSPGNRMVKVTATIAINGEEHETRVEVPSANAFVSLRAQNMPTEENVRALLNVLAAYDWCWSASEDPTTSSQAFEDPEEFPPFGPRRFVHKSEAGASLDLRKLSVRVTRREFDGDKYRVDASTIISLDHKFKANDR